MKEQYPFKTSRRKFRVQLVCAFAFGKLITRGLLVATIAVAVGCGKSSRLENLTGRVTASSDGSPVVGGRLIFHSDGAKNFSATTDQNGYYSAGSIPGGEGIAAGKYVITVVEFTDLEHPKPSKINVKYSQVRTSGLQVDVPAKDDKFDIVLDPP